MSEMTLYHGSKKVIRTPVYGAGRAYNDFGLGFYCTEELDLAKEWAVKKNSNGYVNVYKLDTSGLSILNLNDSNTCTILNWFAILLENRIFEPHSDLAIEARAYILDIFSVNYRDYDIIRGYRADNSYFAYAQDFLMGALSYQQLAQALNLGKLGEQVVVKSEKALERIVFCDIELVEASTWYPRSQLRDNAAKNKCRELKVFNFRREDIYMTKILREEMKADDIRLRQGVSWKRDVKSLPDDGFCSL